MTLPPASTEDYVAQRIALEERARARKAREWLLIGLMSLGFGVFGALTVSAVLVNAKQRDNAAIDRAGCDSRLASRSQANADHAVLRDFILQRSAGEREASRLFHEVAKAVTGSPRIAGLVERLAVELGKNADVAAGELLPRVVDFDLPDCERNVPGTKSTLPPDFKAVPPERGAPAVPAPTPLRD